MKKTSLLWLQLYLEHKQPVQYFTSSSLSRLALLTNTITYLLKTTRKKCTSSTIKCYTFKRQNWCFIFQHIDDIVQIHLNIYPIYQQVSEFLMIMIMIKGVILIVPSQEKNAGCCPWNLRTADCTSASDANFCPPVIFFIGPKRCQSLARLKA